MINSLKLQSDGKPVEVISLLDSQHMKVGKKRNELLSLAIGDYVCFVDDDDHISDDYVDSILEAIETGEDVIVFKLARNHNGNFDRICYFSKEFEKDHDTREAYYRLPNHLMVFKRELAIKVKYKEFFFGEDAEWSKEILPLINSERRIDKVLYVYESNDNASEAQKHYLMSVIINTNWETMAPFAFIEYVQDMTCVSEILIFSDREMNFPESDKVKYFKVDTFKPNEAVNMAKSSKICLLDKDCVLDRYAFHIASVALENDDVQVIGLDDFCAQERTDNEVFLTDHLNPLYEKSVFFRKKDFPIIPPETAIPAFLFETFKGKTYSMKGPKIFLQV
jgi:hypothetical protein